MNKVFSRAIALFATAGLVTACSGGVSSSDSNSEAFGYQVQGPLTTVNAGSAEGIRHCLKSFLVASIQAFMCRAQMAR